MRLCREEAAKLTGGDAATGDARRHGAVPRHPLPAQALGADEGDARPSAHRGGADPRHRTERQVHAVDAVHQERRQAGAGLAPGRGLHPDPRPLARRGVDRARRRHDRQRLPLGDPRLASARHPLAAPPAPEPGIRLRAGILRLPVPRRGRDPGRGRAPEASSSSTATSSTSRSRTGGPAASAGRWSTTT